MNKRLNRLRKNWLMAKNGSDFFREMFPNWEKIKSNEELIEAYERHRLKVKCKIAHENEQRIEEIKKKVNKSGKAKQRV